MDAVTVTRNAQITIPKELKEKLGIREGDKVSLRAEDNKIIIERITEDVWKDCTDFLPANFEKILEKMRKDSTVRFKKLGIIP